MRFDDLSHGGRVLADALMRHPAAQGGIVLGLVRGGVPTALEVAVALDLPLDLVLLRSVMMRSLFDPVRAVSIGGKMVLDAELTGWREGEGGVEEIHAKQAVEELQVRTQLCRGTRAAAEIAGRTVFLVDNGIRTGTSMLGAIKAARRLNPSRLIAAVPVADPARVDFIRGLVDEMVCLATPEPFGNTALWYRRFNVPVEETISAFLDERGRRAS